MTTSLFRFDKTQRKEFGKYLFDLSKICIASLVIKLFEPGSPAFDPASLFTFSAGLTIGLLIAMIALRFTKEIKK